MSHPFFHFSFVRNFLECERKVGVGKIGIATGQRFALHRHILSHPYFCSRRVSVLLIVFRIISASCFSLQNLFWVSGETLIWQCSVVGFDASFAMHPQKPKIRGHLVGHLYFIIRRKLRESRIQSLDLVGTLSTIADWSRCTARTTAARTLGWKA